MEKKEKEEPQDSLQNLLIIVLVLGFIITIILGIAIDQYFDFKMQTLFDVSSTIIQALVALIAFLVILYVYRTKRIRDLKDDQGYWLAQARKGRAIEKGYSEPLSKEQEKEIENEVLRNPIYRENFELYLKKKNKIEAINYPFKISVLLAFFVVIISLLILPFGNFSPPKNLISWFPWVSVSITFEIVFTIIIIIFTAWFVKKII